MTPEKTKAGPKNVTTPAGLAIPVSVAGEWIVDSSRAGLPRSSASSGIEHALTFRTCFSSGSTEVLVAPLDVEPEAVPALTRVLDDAEHDRAGRFVFASDWDQ